MATKKGIIITIGILGVITASSFLVWLIPQTNEPTFVVSDFESYLNNVKEIHQTLLLGIEEEFQNLLDEKISPDDYISVAEISSSQINSEIIQLVGSDPPEEWLESYINYMESLKKFNTYVRESIVVANMIKNEAGMSEIEDFLKTNNEIKMESKTLSKASDDARP